MKLSAFACLVALVALVLSCAFVAASEVDVEREVRSYTAEMEYVDHVDVSQSSDLPVAESATLMETASVDSAPAVDGSSSMHFDMDNEASSSSEEAPASDFDLSSFLEQAAASAAEQEVDTDVARAMAIEIHDAAQANIDEEGEVASFSSSSFVELEADSELEAEAEAEAEAQAESEMEAELEALMEDEAEPKVQKPVLSAKELAQEKADILAEKKAKIQEAKDNAEAKADLKQAKEDAKMTIAQQSQSGGVTTVTLPEDLSASHAETIRVNTVATKTIKGALGEMNAILASKDDTIRSLVYNISYLTVNIGTLANKVDQQRAYIQMLRTKLHNANRKNKELHDHVEHSADTVVAVRNQLKQVEKRLNKQDKTTSMLSDYLTKHKDTVELPLLKDDLVIKGKPVVAPKQAHLARRMRKAIHHKKKHHNKKHHKAAARVSTTMRPVEGTQVYADSHGSVFAHHAPTHHRAGHHVVAQEVSHHAVAPHETHHVVAHEVHVAVPHEAHHTAIPTPMTHPTYQPPTYTQAEAYHGIPTIVIERHDNGQ